MASGSSAQASVCSSRAVRSDDDAAAVGAVGEHPGERGLEQHAGGLQVVDGRPAVLQHDRGVAGRYLGRRRVDPGAAPGAAAHGDERLGLEDAERFAQRRPRDAELRHQDVLGGQRVAVLQLSPNDAVSDMLGHDLRGLGNADGKWPLFELLAPHEGHTTSL